jgi:beta-glucanase (GH16 family)
LREEVGMKLVYWERFDELGAVWSTRGQNYREDSTLAKGSGSASVIKDGELLLKVIADPHNPGKVLTGHEGTEGKFEFLYGKATARIKMHPHHGAHSGFWLQSKEPYAVGHPEIDVVECFGAHNPDRKEGVFVFHTVYYRDTPDGPLLSAQVEVNSKDFGASWHEEYHDYTVHWMPDRYEFYIDGRHTGTITKGLSDTPKYVVFSMLARDWESQDLREHNPKSYKMRVKWLKVWQ